MQKEIREASSLSASNTAIWSNCTAYYGLMRDLEIKGLVFEEEKKEANEGTIAHVVFAKLARKVFSCNTIPPLTKDLFEGIEVEGSDELMRENALMSIKKLVDLIIAEGITTTKCDGTIQLPPFTVFIEHKFTVIEPSDVMAATQVFEYRPRQGGRNESLARAVQRLGFPTHYEDAISYAAFPAFQEVFGSPVEEAPKAVEGHPAPKVTGTSDLILNFHSKKVAYVVDYKYGEGVMVSARDNLQLQMYGIGFINHAVNKMLTSNAVAFKDYNSYKYKLVILQPRLNCYTNDGMTCAQLNNQRKVLINVLADMVTGKGVFKAGDHCQFCKAKSGCPKWGNELAPVFTTIGGRAELTREQRMQIAVYKSELISFIEAVYSSVKQQMEQNKDSYPELDYRLVRQGNRSWRKDLEPAQIAEELKEQGVTDPYKHTLIGITEAEKQTGKGKIDHMTERGYGVYKLERVKNILIKEFDNNEFEIEI